MAEVEQGMIFILKGPVRPNYIYKKCILYFIHLHFIGVAADISETDTSQPGQIKPNYLWDELSREIRECAFV